MTAALKKFRLLVVLCSREVLRLAAVARRCRVAAKKEDSSRGQADIDSRATR